MHLRPMLIGVGLLVAGSTWTSASRGAPLSPFGPVDLCGDIVSVAWYPVAKVAGKRGFSGSLGRDRTFPARFGVLLRNSTGLKPDQRTRMNATLRGAAKLKEGEGEVVVMVNSNDPDLLKNARSLCLYGFRIRGDEGGTWVVHDRVVPKP